MTQIFVLYLSLLIAMIVVFYLLGTGMLKTLNIKYNEPYAELFIRLLAGNCLFVFATSLYITGGVTINLAFIPLFLFFFYFSRNKIATPSSFSTVPLFSRNSKILIELVVVVSIVFLFRFFSIYNNGSLPLIPHGDQVYYANCADYIISSGSENSSVDYSQGTKAGVSPYHYFEIWQSIGFISLFSSNSVLTLVLVTISSGIIIIWVGLCAVFSQFKVITTVDRIFCFIAIFICGIAFSFYKKIAFMACIDVYCRNAFEYPKLLPLYLFLIASVLFFLKGEKEKSILSLLCLPIISISTSPGILGGVLSFLIVDRFWKKKYTPSLMAAVIVLIVSLFVFYKIINKETSTHVSTNLNIWSSLQNMNYIRTCINVVIGASIQILLIYLPFLLILVVLRPVVKKWPSEWLLISSIYIFSLLGWAAMHDKLSSVQVFANISCALLNLLVVVCMMYALVFTSVRKKIVGLIGIAIIILQNIGMSFREYRYEYAQDDSYLAKIKNQSSTLSPIGAFIFSEKQYDSIVFSYVSNFAILGSYLVYSEQKTFPMSISPHNIVLLKNDTMNAKKQEIGRNNTPFYSYVEKQKENHRFHSIEQSQFDFIKEYHINYVIVSKDIAIPYLLKELVQEIITDPKTGEKFILLKNR